MATPTDPPDLDDLLAALAERLAPPAALIGREELAKLLGTSPQTVDRLRASGQIGPASIRLGGVKWDRLEILIWIRHPVRPGQLASSSEWPPMKAMIDKRRK